MSDPPPAPSTPLSQLITWFEEGHDCELSEPASAVLATVDEDGHPAARVVLIRAIDARGLVFYTNLDSDKGRQISAHPYAALCFHWMPLDRQLRVRGSVQPVSTEEANAYFASRTRESQIGAWASAQSQPLESMDALHAQVKVIEARYRGQDVPRPPRWSGLRLIPERVEFWTRGAHRLHHRELYVRQGEGWSRSLLQP